MKECANRWQHGQLRKPVSGALLKGRSRRGPGKDSWLARKATERVRKRNKTTKKGLARGVNYREKLGVVGRGEEEEVVVAKRKEDENLMWKEEEDEV